MGFQESIVHSGQLGYTVNQLGYFIAELGIQLFQRNAAVFDHVVKQSGNDGVVIQVEVCQEEGGF